MQTGIGYDVHKLVEGRKLIIGGVEIPHEKGLLGHSDADVLLHAICDALLGACGLGDIGSHFPDNDPQYKNADSLQLLKRVGHQVKEKGFEIIFIDSIIIAEAPKMAPYKNQMRAHIAKALNIRESIINIKAKTEEGLGFTGTKQGMAAWAVATVTGIL